MNAEKEDTKDAKDTKVAKVCLLVLALSVAVVPIGASDRIGIYGVIDKVAFEPNGDNPEFVQLWGRFAVATRNDRDLYDAVQTGYLYFRLPSEQRLARAEWKDLKAIAGTQKIVAFSARFGQSVRVRAADEKPQSPDTYALGTGVQTIRPDRDYAPIKALSVHISR